MEKPYALLEAVPYKELNSHTAYFHVDALEHILVVKLPRILKNYIIHQIDDLSKTPKRAVNFFNRVNIDIYHPWLEIPLDILDITAGKHTYKIGFVDTVNGEVLNLYFSYITQDDNPETPYIYMPGRGNTDTEANAYKHGKYEDQIEFSKKDDSDEDVDASEPDDTTETVPDCAICQRKCLYSKSNRSGCLYQYK